MLAASGVLGLLLMSAAVGGLMAGDDGGDAGSDGTDSGDASGPDAANDPDAPAVEPMWAGDFSEDGSLESVMPSGPADTPLAQLLFPEMPPPSAEFDEDDAFAHLEESDGAARSFDVLETIPFPGGPDIHCVLGFEHDTDRLILDFEGTEAEAPEITIDLDTLPGSALVNANGTTVALVEGADGLTPDHVEVAMSGMPSNADGSGEEDSNVPDTSLPRPNDGLEFVSDFDRSADQIEILYDPHAIDDPVVEIEDFVDGSGASVLLNGEPVLHVAGAQGLDPDQVILSPSNALSPPPAGTT